MTEISLIIPAYNEAAIIQNTVRELDAFMNREMPGSSLEIIIVDDGSTDGMGDKLDALNMPNLRSSGTCATVAAAPACAPDFTPPLTG